MNSTHVVVAKRYAQAFFNIFGDTITEATFNALVNFEAYLVHNRHHVSLFVIAHIDEAVKHVLLHKLFERYNLQALLGPLASLLIKDKRIFLLPLVIKSLIVLYKEREKIMTCSITSSHALQPENLSALKNFLARSTGCDIIYDYKVNKDLIAGIRLQSDTVLWEYSIRRQLARVGLPLIR